MGECSAHLKKSRVAKCTFEWPSHRYTRIKEKILRKGKDRGLKEEGTIGQDATLINKIQLDRSQIPILSIISIKNEKLKAHDCITLVVYKYISLCNENRFSMYIHSCIL